MGVGKRHEGIIGVYLARNIQLDRVPLFINRDARLIQAESIADERRTRLF